MKCRETIRNKCLPCRRTEPKCWFDLAGQFALLPTSSDPIRPHTTFRYGPR